MVDLERNVERNKEILELWGKGFSHSNIVILLKQQGYEIVTRSCIGGVIHRAGAGRPAGVKSTFVVRLARPKAPQGQALQAYRPKPAPVIALDAPDEIGPIEDFPDEGCCHHLAGDVKVPGWRYCGQPTKGKRISYCDYHTGMMHPIDGRTAAGKQMKVQRVG